MKPTKMILIIGVLVVLTALLLGRYEFVPSQQGYFAYRLDRWTGAVRAYTLDGWSELNEDKEAAPKGIEEIENKAEPQK